MNLVKLTNGLVRFFYRYMVASGQWIVLGWPYLFFALALSYARSMDEIRSLVLVALALLPFVLSPAMVAVFRTLATFSEADESVPNHIWQRSWRTVRQSYWMTVKVSAVAAVMLAIVLNATLYYSHHSVFLMGVHLLLCVLVCVAYLMSLTFVTLREQTWQDYLKNGVLMTLSNAIIALLVGGGAAVLLVVSFHTPMFPLVCLAGPSLVGAWVYHVYVKTLARAVLTKQ